MGFSLVLPAQNSDEGESAKCGALPLSLFVPSWGAGGGVAPGPRYPGDINTPAGG